MSQCSPMPYPARPTLRCLREELLQGLVDSDQRSALASGDVDSLDPINLEELHHPLLAKVTEQIVLADWPRNCTPARIKSVSDNTFYKVRVERWRGAVW